MLSPVDELIDGRFRVIRLLGEGGFGQVFLAEQSGVDRKVAIKFLDVDGVEPDESSLTRFRREGQALAGLNHQNIVSCFAFGIWRSKYPYLVLEYVEGETLWDKIVAESTLPWVACFDLCIAVCAGLNELHANGLVHRDIKPQNIITTNDGITKLIDLGLVGMNNQRLTRTGLIVGSPLYMSPEEAVGKKATPASDIYSLGCVIYHALAGITPFRSLDPLQVLQMHVHKTAMPLHELNPRIPKSVSAVVQRAMEKKPGLRYRTARELGSALRGAMQSENRSDAHTSTVGTQLVKSLWLESQTQTPDYPVETGEVQAKKCGNKQRLIADGVSAFIPKSNPRKLPFILTAIVVCLFSLLLTQPDAKQLLLQVGPPRMIANAYCKWASVLTMFGYKEYALSTLVDLESALQTSPRSERTLCAVLVDHANVCVKLKMPAQASDLASEALHILATQNANDPNAEAGLTRACCNLIRETDVKRAGLERDCIVLAKREPSCRDILIEKALKIADARLKYLPQQKLKFLIDAIWQLTPLTDRKSTDDLFESLTRVIEQGRCPSRLYSQYVLTGSDILISGNKLPNLTRVIPKVEEIEHTGSPLFKAYSLTIQSVHARKTLKDESRAAAELSRAILVMETLPKTQDLSVRLHRSGMELCELLYHLGQIEKADLELAKTDFNAQEKLTLADERVMALIDTKRFEEAEAQLDKLIDSPGTPLDTRLGLICRGHYLGRITKSDRITDKYLQRMRSLAIPREQKLSLLVGWIVTYLDQNRWSAANALAKEAVAMISKSTPDRVKDVAYFGLYASNAQLHQNLDQSESSLKRLYSQTRTTGNHCLASWCLISLAEIRSWQNRIPEQKRYLDDARTIATAYTVPEARSTWQPLDFTAQAPLLRAQFERLHDSDGLAWSSLSLAQIRCEHGQVSEAKTVLERTQHVLATGERWDPTARKKALEAIGMSLKQLEKNVGSK